ncbi:hypothetical protein OIU85_004417 [Salix viminalis]|uniref:Uncharacterized protein n=1 Tax=Salix viminalis TaxID=40686 RepID=A0A9Q0PT88_SALVM|nr:hypothetical protein OIU85_004417 [Salix viminalis]
MYVDVHIFKTANRALPRAFCSFYLESGGSDSFMDSPKPSFSLTGPVTRGQPSKLKITGKSNRFRRIAAHKYLENRLRAQCCGSYQAKSSSAHPYLFGSDYVSVDSLGKVLILYVPLVHSDEHILRVKVLHFGIA